MNLSFRKQLFLDHTNNYTVLRTRTKQKYLFLTYSYIFNTGWMDLVKKPIKQFFLYFVKTTSYVPLQNLRLDFKMSPKRVSQTPPEMEAEEGKKETS